MTAPLWWTACIDCRRQIGEDHEPTCPQEGQVSRFDTCQFIPARPRNDDRTTPGPLLPSAPQSSPERADTTPTHGD